MEIQTKATQTLPPSRQAIAMPAVPASAPRGGEITFTVPKSEVKVDAEQMKKNLDQAIRQLNDSMRDGGRNLAFAMDEALGRPVIVVKKKGYRRSHSPDPERGRDQSSAQPGQDQRLDF